MVVIFVKSVNFLCVIFHPLSLEYILSLNFSKLSPRSQLVWEENRSYLFKSLLLPQETVSEPGLWREL
jgi:hypothetical protein